MLRTGFTLGDLTKNTPYGNLDKLYGRALYGINRNTFVDTRSSIRHNVGLTFFTRPMLNLSAANLRRFGFTYMYLNKDHDSVETHCRMLLDRLIYYNENIDNHLTDNLSAFMPILSNNLVSLTGFLDPTVDSYVSPAGFRKQQYNLLDGTDEINESMDLTAVFNNTVDDGVYKLLSLWFRYMPRVKEGIMSPYAGFIARRIVDYQSRIFRLVLSEDRKYVVRIGATGPIYPDVHAVGKYFEVTDNASYNQAIKTHSVRFKCMGVEYDLPILTREFNRTVGFFNPMMRKVNDGVPPEEVGLVKLSPLAAHNTDFIGYPRIADDNELEWYVKGSYSKLDEIPDEREQVRRTIEDIKEDQFWEEQDRGGL